MTSLPPSSHNRTNRPIADRHVPDKAEIGPNITRLSKAIGVLVIVAVLILLMHILGGTLSEAESTLLALAIGAAFANHATS